MKMVNKILSIVFAIMIVGISITVILYVGGIVKTDNVTNILDMLVETRNSKLITIISASVIALISIIFAINVDTSESSNGSSLILPLTTGNISITGQTFETIVLNIAKRYNNFKNVKVSVKIREDGLYVTVNTYILEGTIVADVIAKLQQDVKTVILKQTTVEVKTVEVKIKGIYQLSEALVKD
ncbi:MAG: Asp23/Gls24 family envelope stress response protein [Clostridia bacterium]|nr:Asp23/Gls24 family envelope stress response protein [Clostridia bacterium]MDD4375749.1 Asp23/Gls24 family envelope stress response protein [Clostridia bacterium]